MRNEAQYMGVTIVKWRLDKPCVVSKVWRSHGVICALRQDGAILYSNDRFFKYAVFEKNLEYPSLVQGMRALGAITKEQHADYCGRIEARNQKRSLANAASEVLSGAKTLGIKLTAAQERRIGEARSLS